MQFMLLVAAAAAVLLGVVSWYRHKRTPAAGPGVERRREQRRRRSEAEAALIHDLVERGRAAGEERGRQIMAAHHGERIAGIAVMLEELLEELEELDAPDRRHRAGLVLRHVRLLQAEDVLLGAPTEEHTAEVMSLADVLREAARGVTRAGTSGLLDLQLSNPGVDWVRCDRVAMRGALEALFGLCVRARTSPEDRLLVRLDYGRSASPFQVDMLGGLLVTIVVPGRVELLAAETDLKTRSSEAQGFSPWRQAAAVIFAHGGDMAVEGVSETRSVVRISLPAAEAPAWAGRPRIERGPAWVLVREAPVRWVMEGALAREGFVITSPSAAGESPPRGGVLVADVNHPVWGTLAAGVHSVMVMDGGVPPANLPANTLRVHRPFSSDDATRIARSLALQYDAS